MHLGGTRLRQLLRGSKHAAQWHCKHVEPLQTRSHVVNATDQNAAPGPPVRQGQELQLTCARFAVGRKGVCLLPPTDYVVLCDRALPGEKLLARITSVKKGYATADKLQVLEPHADATEPLCQHFGPCGGCSYQNLQYAAQLVAKQDQVVQQLRRVGKVEDLEAVMRPILGCRKTYAYRNKMSFTFSTLVWDPTKPGNGSSSHQAKQQSNSKNSGKWKNQKGRRGRADDNNDGTRFALGLFKPGSNEVVMPVYNCLLQSDAANEVLEVVQAVAAEVQASAYNPRAHQGLLRQCIIRKGTDPDTGGEELMVVLVTRQYKEAELQPFLDALTPLPHVASISCAVAPGRGPPQEVIRETRLLAGQPRIRERICGLLFDISPQSFFQTNTQQTEVLYQAVADAAALREDRSDVVLDLYCGTGTIGLSLASRCKEVHGVEIVASAVQDAKLNAERNGISNATFTRADLSNDDVVKQVFATIKPDVIVLDPARGGLEGSAMVELLSNSGARRLVYVSCNPTTQARDIDRLCHQEGSRYRLASVQPVDMFPHTDHVESVAVLDLAG